MLLDGHDKPNTPMGKKSSRKRPSIPSNTLKLDKVLRMWRDTRRDVFTYVGYKTTAAASANEVPPDNIFVPIQPDDIPVARRGVEDDDLRTLHTNKFYANAFLGEQNQPIWTHPYSIWWGKGGQEQGMLQTWGMNVAHVEEADLQYGPGDPPKVRLTRNDRKF
jgi:endo-1,3(4)-beta-glucanase